MKVAVVLGVGIVFSASGYVSAAVKDDPAKLPLNELPQYFEKRRNLDRWLQQGQFGPVIKVGKEILRDFVSEDAYAAFCLAAAYGSMDPDPEGQEDYYEESIEFLEKAIQWGFRNVAILKTSSHFEKVRKDKEKSKAFAKLLEELEAKVAREAEGLKARFREEIERAIGEGKKVPFKLDAKTACGEPMKAGDLAGKPLIVVVLRPRHDAVDAALPGVKKLAAAAAEKGVRVIGAIYNHSYTDRLEREAAAFVEAAKLTFPCALVDRGWAKQHGVLNLPAHLLVSQDGAFLYRLDGLQVEEWRLTMLVEIAAKGA